MNDRVVYCRRCGTALAVVVSTQAEYDVQTGILGSVEHRRWDCPEGARLMGLGYEGGHTSPDAEALP